jgi:hypothetical protein
VTAPLQPESPGELGPPVDSDHRRADLIPDHDADPGPSRVLDLIPDHDADPGPGRADLIPDHDADPGPGRVLDLISDHDADPGPGLISDHNHDPVPGLIPDRALDRDLSPLPERAPGTGRGHGRNQRAWEAIPIEGDFTVITADQVRELSGREPRLMMKFDHSYQLPPALADEGKFILPLKNGLYAILKGQGYHQPEPCPPPIDFPRRNSFELETSVSGVSEMQHLDLAFNTGLFAEFTGQPMLYPTLRGRKYSPAFSFSVGPHRLEVESVQIEIDQGYEGPDCIIVVEAKIGECKDFHLRQLYYPFRAWRQQSNKAVRPIFFTYEPSSGLYRFREYAFEPEEIYQAPRLVKAAAYRLVDPVAAVPARLSARSAAPVPQADKMSRIADIPILVALGYSEPGRLAERMAFDPRQGRYYLDAARALGLLSEDYSLTPAGLEYVQASPPLRQQMLARSILGQPLVREVLVSLLLAPQGRLQREEVIELIVAASALSPSTATRRAQTLWAWLGWLGRVGGARLAVEKEEIRLLGSPSQDVQPPSGPLQLDLF